MMNQLKICHDSGLAWIGLSSVNNTIGLALLEELESLLAECQESTGSQVLIIHGSGGKFFSPGLNLHEVSRLDRAGMSSFMKVFTRVYLGLFSCPKPVLAMVNGDALAGGFLFASCCDFRYGRSGVRVGLTELSRTVTMPFGSLKILERLIGVQATREISSKGQSLSAEQAFQMGWFDGIFSDGVLKASVRLRAMDLARDATGVSDLRTFDDRRALVDQIWKDEGRHLEEFLDHWFSQEAQLQIGAMVKALNRIT